MSDSPETMVSNMPYALGGPCISGVIRQQPEDFIVTEIPGFTPDGQGDHVFLSIEKKQLNTNDVVKKLSDLSGVSQREIGYAGMKDRNAVTTQTFSVNLAGKQIPDWHLLESGQLRVLDISRHRRKLKRGVLKGNSFKLVIRELQGDFAALEQRLLQIQQRGAPNYFGPQRFGRNGRNIEDTREMLAGRLQRVPRNLKSILLSAARSLLFNAVLSERVRQGNWDQLLSGEVIALDGSERHFKQEIDEVLLQRCAEMDVHASGPLPGKASRAIDPDQQAGEIENDVLSAYREWIDGLQAFGVERARRPLRIAVRNMNWKLDAVGKTLELDFSLTSGAYATAVLREVMQDSE